MLEKLVIIMLSLFVGVLLTRIFNYVEIHSLKDQLMESERDNEAIVKDNADLSRQNDVLRRKLWEIEKQKENPNIPKFGD